uniref:Uncharacterized protein n=1 Tax=Lepeophtheirus salmonis TaxID=72036 RepID=A0A0K2UIF4_LEPSM
MVFANDYSKLFINSIY